MNLNWDGSQNTDDLPSPSPMTSPMTMRPSSTGDLLASTHWLPRRFDSSRVMDAIEKQDVSACHGDCEHPETGGLDVVERLAVCYGLLRVFEADGKPPPTPLFETLETLGFEISSDFAESGSDAYFLTETVASLDNGADITPMTRNMAFACLGRLWARAFSAPHGFDHFVSRSALGRETRELSFFANPRKPHTLSAEDLSTYLKELIDQLQAAIAARALSSHYVTNQLSLGDWHAPAWAIYIPARGTRPLRVVVHVKKVSLARNVTRFIVKFTDASTNQDVASISGVLLEGDSGAYDDYLELSEHGGPVVDATVRAIFSPENVVGLYPRVRWFLEQAENRIYRVLVIEGMFSVREWRGRNLSNHLLEQLVVETGMVDVLLGRPRMLDASVSEDSAPLGVQAAAAGGLLSMARHFAASGAEHLISGAMGMGSQTIQRLHDEGTRARMS